VLHSAFHSDRKSGIVYFMYGRSVSTEGWKGFSLDVEIIENLVE
jgi:hypothetical protein